MKWLLDFALKLFLLSITVELLVLGLALKKCSALLSGWCV